MLREAVESLSQPAQLLVTRGLTRVFKLPKRSWLLLQHLTAVRQGASFSAELCLSSVRLKLAVIKRNALGGGWRGKAWQEARSALLFGTGWAKPPETSAPTLSMVLFIPSCLARAGAATRLLWQGLRVS